MQRCHESSKNWSSDARIYNFTCTGTYIYGGEIIQIVAWYHRMWYNLYISVAAHERCCTWSKFLSICLRLALFYSPSFLSPPHLRPNFSKKWAETWRCKEAGWLAVQQQHRGIITGKSKCHTAAFESLPNRIPWPPIVLFVARIYGSALSATVPAVGDVLPETKVE